MGLLGLIAGAGSADGPYESGEIATEIGPGSVRTIGCLDVGLQISGYDSDALLELHIGNRCVRNEPFDFEKVAIHATSADGGERSVSLNDPRHEIVALHVAAQERGRARIRIANLRGVDHICFELGAVAPAAPEARPAPLCLERYLDGWSAAKT